MTGLRVSYTRYTASVASECMFVVSSIKQAMCLSSQHKLGLPLPTASSVRRVYLGQLRACTHYRQGNWVDSLRRADSGLLLVDIRAFWWEAAMA